MRLASILPNCTLHWANEKMFQDNALCEDLVLAGGRQLSEGLRRQILQQSRLRSFRVRHGFLRGEKVLDATKTSVSARVQVAHGFDHMRAVRV